MSPNETITSEKYKQQALNSLDSSYGIILRNGAFMLDDNFTLVCVDSISNFKNKYISDKYLFIYKYITQRRIQEQMIEPVGSSRVGRHSSLIHHSNPISQEISYSHIQSIRKNVQDSIGRKYFELDNELVKISSNGVKMHGVT